MDVPESRVDQIRFEITFAPTVMQCSARTVLRASRVVRPTLSARLATSATEKSGQQAAQDAFGNAVRHAQMGLKLVEEKLGSALGGQSE